MCAATQWSQNTPNPHYPGCARARTVQLHVDDLREAFYCAICIILIYYSPVFDCNMVVFFRNPYWHSLTIRATQTSQGTLVSINDL